MNMSGGSSGFGGSGKRTTGATKTTMNNPMRIKKRGSGKSR